MLKSPFKLILSKSIAEMIGTFAICFFGCGFFMVSGTDLPQITPVVFGATVALMIYATGHLSGAHFNPAVTLAFTLVGRFPLKHIGWYLSFQFLGGLLGIFLLFMLFPQATHFGATLPALSTGRVFLVEVVLSFFLMFVIISVATDSRAAGVMAGLAIGATVTVCAFFGGPLTGASMNPARSLAPALFQGESQSLWIYMIAPIIGTCLAALTYEFIRCEEKNTEVELKGC